MYQTFWMRQIKKEGWGSKNYNEAMRTKFGVDWALEQRTIK